MLAVLMGPPGAGKGTQAERIAERFAMTHLSSGDIFRAEKSSGSELGKQIAAVMARGELVSDALVVEIMVKAIQSVEGGLLLDGFPRTLPQAEVLDGMLGDSGLSVDAVILITADDETIVKRITGRRSCPQCGKAFHVDYMPSAKGTFCDACDGEVRLVQRDDDSESVVRQRLEAYKGQTEPVIDYYQQRDGVTVIVVDGEQSPEEVTASISQELSKLAG